MNGHDGDFLAKLGAERERLTRLVGLIQRKRGVLRDACTRLRLGVDPETVAFEIVQVCRAELRELDVLPEYDGGDQ